MAFQGLLLLEYVVVLKGPRILFCGGTLRTLSPDSSCQLDVFWHDGDSPGVDSTQIGIFKQTDKVRLRCLLKTQERCCLEPQACLDILCDLPHYPLEGQLSDEQRCTALVMTDVFQSHSSRSVPVGLYSPPLHPCLVDLPLLLIRPVQHTMAQLSSLLGTRDVEGWQLPINRRVSHDPSFGAPYVPSVVLAACPHLQSSFVCWDRHRHHHRHDLASCLLNRLHHLY